MNKGKIDDAVLALLHLTSFEDYGVTRSWKGHDWDALSRLHQQGLIEDPKGKRAKPWKRADLGDAVAAN